MRKLELTKAYRIVYIGNILQSPLQLSEKGTTLVQEGMNGAEFDTKAEAEEFIKQNKLSYSDE